MNELVSELGGVVLPTGRAKVAVCIEVSLQHAVDASHESEAANIELALVNKKRLVNVPLDNVRVVACLWERIYLQF